VNNKRSFSEFSSSPLIDQSSTTQEETTNNNNNEQQPQTSSSSSSEEIPTDTTTTTADVVVEPSPKRQKTTTTTTSLVQQNKQQEEEEENDDDGSSSGTKTPKRKVALIIGYDGSKYNGLQTNPLVTTIEDVLLEALVASGGVSQENANLKKIAWGRASRTDKGVSAVLNVVCLRMIMLPDIIQKLNVELDRIVKEKNLSPVNVYQSLRVTSSYDPKRSCNGRKYQYVIPTFAFEPIAQLTEQQKWTDAEKFVKLEEQMSVVTMQELLDSRSFIEGYRLSQERLEQVRALFKKYIGTKCYHNFTQRAKTNPDATMRYVTNFTVSEPFVNESDPQSVEHVVLTVEGQSFVLNQIRKMVGFVVAVARGHIAESDFEVALHKNQRYYVPMVPGFGLLLDELYFDHYNDKFGAIHGKFDWNDEDLKPKISAFKQIIVNNIVKRESDLQTMSRWLYILPRTLQTDLLQPGLVRTKPQPENTDAQNTSSKKDNKNKWKNKQQWKNKNKKKNNKNQQNNQQADNAANTQSTNDNTSSAVVNNTASVSSDTTVPSASE